MDEFGAVGAVSVPTKLSLSAHVVERLDTAVLLRELAVKELNALGERL